GSRIDVYLRFDARVAAAGAARGTAAGIGRTTWATGAWAPSACAVDGRAYASALADPRSAPTRRTRDGSIPSNVGGGPCVANLASLRPPLGFAGAAAEG